MSFTRDEQGARAALGVAAGVLSDGERSLDQIRRLGMTERQQFLNFLWSFFSTTQYEGRKVAWDGSEAMERVEYEMAAASLNTLDGSVGVIVTSPMLTPRAAHATGLLCDGTVLVIGGTDEARPAERYVPGRGARP